MYNFRVKLWQNIVDDLGPPEGCITPCWLIAVRLAIFPLGTLHALLHAQASPFDLHTLTWNVYGQQYSDQFFRQIAIADRMVLKVERINGVARFTRLYDLEANQ